MTATPFVTVLTGRSTAMYSDINEDHAPLAAVTWRAIRHGHFPVWSHLIFGGQNMVGAGQAAVFYVPNAFFGWLDPVTAYRWWLLFHVWLAAAGAFAWSWHRWRSLPGAMVSGVAYGLDGFLVLHLVHMPLVAMAAWIPWAFLGLDLVIDRWTLRRAALLAGSVAAIALTGHPQGLWQAGIGLGVVTVVLLTRSGRGVGPWVRAVGGLALGLGLAAVQLLPTFLFSRTSIRPALNVTDAFTFSSEPRFLTTLAVPRMLGSGTLSQWGSVHLEASNYLGVTVLALAIIAVVHLGKDRRSAGLLAIAAFGLVTSLAGHTPVGRLVYDVVPLARNFRAWGRNLILVNVAVSCLAGAGVRAVLATPARWGRSIALGALGLATTLLVLPALTDLGDRIVQGRERALAFGLPTLLLLGLWAAVTVLPSRRDLGVALVVLLCCFDMVVFASTAAWHTDQAPVAEVEEFYSARPAEIGPPADAPGGIDRWVAQDGAPRGVALAKGFPAINGYDPIVQADFAHTVSDMDGAGGLGRKDFLEPGWLADVLRVTTLFVRGAAPPRDPLWQRDRYIAHGVWRWTRTPRLDEAELIADVRTASLPAIRDALVAPDTDLTRTAFVESSYGMPVGTATPGDTAADGAVLSGAMGHYGTGRFEIEATRPALLVISSTWLEGWHATVDGSPAPVVRANGLVLGVAVPPGRHTVRLRFVPPGLRLGMAISALCLGALGAPSLVLLARRRRRSRVAVSG